MSWWNYLLLVNIYLILFYGFYALLLRRETFFQMNRVYLVGAALLSFIIPVIQSDWIKDLFITQKVQYVVYGTGPAVNITALAPIKDSPYTLGQLFVMLYVAGVMFLAIRLMWQFILLRRVIKEAVPTPYSFFNKINVDEDAHGSDVILAHEQVHAKQWHSADVLVIEAVMIINWFNPVVYLYRFAIKHIHEYIADRQAIQGGTSKADYALLLLSQTFHAPAHQLVNPFFNHSLLKQRIMMLQKSRSGRVKLMKYGLSAPLFILMLVLSSATISNSKAVATINNKAEWVFTRPANLLLPADGQPERALKLKLQDNDIAKLTAEEKSAASFIDTPKALKVYTTVEKSPSFPGGDKAFSRYLGKTIRYPKIARENNVQGRVILTFIVEKNGSLSDIKVLRGIGSGCDEEAVRAIKASPRWTPGMQKGKKVRVSYAVPINFALAPDEDKAVVIRPKGIKNNAVTTEQNEPLFTAVEQQPTFPGGDKAFGDYIRKSIRYPDEARINKVQGRVIATFTVGKQGEISDIKIVRGIGYGADEEAVRVIKNMPNWNPGIQNGRTVRVQYSIPILFNLNSDDGRLQGKINPETHDILQEAKDSAAKYGSTKKVSIVHVRGVNDPLYVIDGKEATEINTLDPKDIESITVLKDKNAVAKYGAKALNGVVEVVTKNAVKK